MSIKRLFFWLKREDQIKFWIRVQQDNWPRHKLLSTLAHSIIYHRYHCDISPRAKIDSTVYFPHPLGIVIGTGCIIKENVHIYQNVTLGMKNVDGVPTYPIVEKNVIIYPNSLIVGKVSCGENSIIGAGSVVLKDVEPNSICAGNPAHLIKYNL